jgi:hypothetical protein
MGKKLERAGNTSVKITQLSSKAQRLKLFYSQEGDDKRINKN